VRVESKEKRKGESNIDGEKERGEREIEKRAMHHLCLFTLYMLRSYPFSLQTLSMSLDLRS